MGNFIPKHQHKNIENYSQEESRFFEACLCLEDYLGPIDDLIKYYLVKGSEVCNEEDVEMYEKLVKTFKEKLIPNDHITFRSFQILFLYECSQKKFEFSMYENALKIVWSNITDPLLTKVEFVSRLFKGITVFSVFKILSAWDWYRNLIRRDEGPAKCPKIIEQFSRIASRRSWEELDNILVALWLCVCLVHPITKEKYVSVCPRERFAEVDYEEYWNWYCGLMLCPEKNPRSLKHLSRCAIIHKLKECSQLADGVEQLNLPETCKQYILLKDLNEIN